MSTPDNHPAAPARAAAAAHAAAHAASTARAASPVLTISGVHAATTEVSA